MTIPEQEAAAREPNPRKHEAPPDVAVNTTDGEVDPSKNPEDQPSQKN